MAEGDTPAWRLLRGLRAYRAAYEAQAEPPAFEAGTAFPVRVQSEADLAARDPWRIEAWENPFARDGPASPFLAGEAMLEAEGSATAPPLLPFLAGVGARGRRAQASRREPDRQDRAGRARGPGRGHGRRSAARRRGLPAPPRLRAGGAAGDRPADGAVGRLGRSGPSARVGAVGEERELLMALALNRAKVASQRELAIAWWGLDEVGKHWDPNGWVRGQVRYRLEVAREIERRREDGG